MTEGPGQLCWAQVLACDRPQGWVPIPPGHRGQRDTLAEMSRVQRGTRKSQPLRQRPNPWSGPRGPGGAKAGGEHPDEPHMRSSGMLPLPRLGRAVTRGRRSLGRQLRLGAMMEAAVSAQQG